MNFKINTDTWFIFCLSFMGVLTLLISLYIIIPYRTRKRTTKRRQNRLNKKIDNFNELEKKYQKNKIIDLKNINNKLQITLKNDLSNILNNKNADFEVFYSNFEKLYPNFKENISKKGTNLTVNELKLCAFIRLNLSSKEISKLLNITPESVHKARYRLRKKLNLSSKEDLSTFILNT
jgi:DNA-binding CsgD family transcriptional regulator